MKNLVIIIGTILLGVFIVTNLILGEGDGSLKTTAKDVTDKGIESIREVFN